MKVLVVVPDYPSENSVGYQFVHDRVKKYAHKIEIDIFKYNKNHVKDYTIDNISVSGGNAKRLNIKIKNGNYSKIVFHFLTFRSAFYALFHLKNKEVFIWFHGTDSISWKRRLSKFGYSKKKLLNPIYSAKILIFIIMSIIRKTIIRLLNKYYRTTFIFISNWHRKTSEKDFKIKYKVSQVIPNYIDFDTFKYFSKKEKDRFNVLTINNYSDSIYAGDMIRDIILKFSSYNEFKYFTFNIYGDGVLFDEYISKPLERFSNVNITKAFINHDKIQKIHNQNGVFLYPKRGDTQGVSRCEAMASGLVPIASCCEAISEFSPNNTSYLVNTIDEFINALLDIYNNPKNYCKKSVCGQEFIRKKCSYENTIAKEIEILEE